MLLGIQGIHHCAWFAAELVRELFRVWQSSEDTQPRRTVGVLHGREVLSLGRADVAPHLGEREEEQLVVGEVEAGQVTTWPGPLLGPEAGEGPEGRLQSPVVGDVLPEGLDAVDVFPGLRGQVAILCLQTLGPLLVGQQRVIAPPVPHVPVPVILPTLKTENRQEMKEI